MIAGTLRAIIMAIIGNILIASFKFFAAMISGSSALMAEAYHSVSDTGNQILLLFGHNLSKRKPDDKHPFGYGKEKFFWSFVVALALFGTTGVLSIREGILKLQHPEPIQQYGWTMAAIGFGLILDGATLRYALGLLQKFKEREGISSTWEAIQESKDATTLTVIFEDLIAVLGLIIVGVAITLSYFTGNMTYDAVASMMIGGLLLFFAIVLAYEIKDLLIGESLSIQKRIKIRKIVEQFDEVEKILSLRTMHFTENEVLINIEIEFKDDLKVPELEKLIDNIEADIKRIVPDARIYIEPESSHNTPISGTITRLDKK